ncbi:hypothetical protein [Enterococcus pallens]|uniref:Uncharacterized protein n=1 Tax=Enterococcus pallens ATCC BAA-351 TaxID=1158607 RepID=R2RSK8_9ENTE|nr:hypothetical protein [Enterococcus pallens]EOH86340.1 hypothetical protein UAU_05262 [Enterococcus pallens ATCC BAA-351]EOU09439.1 hypothetical protein I588_05172 [Enterococcus pallens ATCC BAA-351]
MNINDAMKLLEKNNVTNSKQMLRRWIRQNKIKAVLKSKKQGYEIDATSLEVFIKEKLRNDQKPGNSDFQKGYKAGYDAALQEVSERYKKMAVMGMYESNFPIYRNEFRELCSRRISKHRLNDFLIFVDKEFFAKQVSKPRNKIWCNSIGNFFYFELTQLLIDQHDYEVDSELSLDAIAYDLLLRRLNEQFIDADSSTSKIN